MNTRRLSHFAWRSRGKKSESLGLPKERCVAV